MTKYKSTRLSLQFSKNLESMTLGARRDRTDDLRLAKPALSQLSYSPAKYTLNKSIQRPQAKAMGLARFELATSRLSGVRSNQLSYSPGHQTLKTEQHLETSIDVNPEPIITYKSYTGEIGIDLGVALAFARRDSLERR